MHGWQSLFCAGRSVSLNGSSMSATHFEVGVRALWQTAGFVVHPGPSRGRGQRASTNQVKP
jgi:hypothetical protein